MQDYSTHALKMRRLDSYRNSWSLYYQRDENRAVSIWPGRLSACAQCCIGLRPAYSKMAAETESQLW